MKARVTSRVILMQFCALYRWCAAYHQLLQGEPEKDHNLYYEPSFSCLSNSELYRIFSTRTIVNS